ncbi:NUDIX hydrolase [Clostridium paridis]|uniref:NUDIX domain-containing protein n=1 Tax=Clostridium paridis TaxID=2803863 RepID=A0A937K4N2_9CLOT|nr:NUDIX domain-containing protein [Clostridium paridis]MBL4931708.1 NUDIX domain-containing protein [Clostridium paridis]
MNNKIIYFATKALIIKDNKFLAVHKSSVDHNLFELPGGRLEYGETPEETLDREIKEELSLKVNPLRILDTWTYIDDNFQIAGIIYLCTIKEGTVTLSDEHDRFEWLPFEKESTKYMNCIFEGRMNKWDFEVLLKELQ